LLSTPETQDYRNVSSAALRTTFGQIHSFIHSGHFYSASSSPLLLRGAPDYSTDTVSEFHAEAPDVVKPTNLSSKQTCLELLW